MRPPQPAGTGLVVLRNQLIDTELEREVGKLNSGRARSSPNFEPDYATGLRAADDVALNQGVGGPSRSAGMIGGAR